MEIPTKKQHLVQDRENIDAVKGKKVNMGLPVQRRALRDLDNIQTQLEANVGKVAVASAKYEKKTPTNRAAVKSKYAHVKSKIDTGLVAKPVQSSSRRRPPLTRQENTESLALVARSKVVPKEAKPAKEKKPLSTLLPVKKVSQQKTTKVSSKNKDPAESLGKLKLSDNKYEEANSDSQETQLPDDIVDIDAASPLKYLEATSDSQEIQLPDGIEDIDSASPLVSIYIKDINKYWMKLEDQYPIEEDHLKIQSEISGECRAKLINWLVEVYRQLNLNLETFQLAVGSIDRYLQTVPNVQHARIQLIGVTALYIASKYEEIYPPDAFRFACATGYTYFEEDVFECEKEILAKLGFSLARPIPVSFLFRLVKAGHGTSKQHFLAKYFIDLCLLEYTMAHYKPSELAAAAICLSLHLLDNKPLNEVWTPTLRYYSEYSLQHIEPIIKKIAKLVVNVENSKYKAIYNHYSDVTLDEVSSLPQLTGGDIRELAQSAECQSLSGLAPIVS